MPPIGCTLDGDGRAANTSPHFGTVVPCTLLFPSLVMIARTPPRPQPIPFADPNRAAAGARPSVCWSPTSPPASIAATAAPTPAPQPHAAAPVGRGTPLRVARARYDGPGALSVRSSATGRLYRFTQPGAIETIDAADTTLMRRIDGITLL